MPMEGLATLPILVVDDSSFMRRTVREVLTSNGLWNVTAAADGAEALECCRANEPAVIVLDWNMPFLDGPEFLKLLRSDIGAPGRKARVVVITGHPTQRLMDEAKRWEVDFVIRKPFSSATLHQRVATAAERRSTALGAALERPRDFFEV